MNNFYFYDKMREQHQKDIAAEVEARKILKQLKASKANNPGILKRFVEYIQSMTVGALRTLECYSASKLYSLFNGINAESKPC